MAAGLHVCFAQKVTSELQVAVEMEGSLRTQECITTLGYQLELPKPGVTFKGDSRDLDVVFLPCSVYLCVVQTKLM